MTYRNDHDAAVARIDALEHENAVLTGRNEALARENKRLERESVKRGGKAIILPRNGKSIPVSMPIASKKARPKTDDDALALLGIALFVAFMIFCVFVGGGP